MKRTATARTGVDLHSDKSVNWIARRHVVQQRVVREFQPPPRMQR